MTTLQSRPKRASAWLPNQVVYGIDMTDADPAKWTPFGEHVDAVEAEKAKHGPKPESRNDK